MQFMANKRTDLPPELLSKEFLKQFRTKEDVSKFFILLILRLSN